MVKSIVTVPVYARRAIETGNVWSVPPCVNGHWDEYKSCPASEGKCPHAEIVRGNIKSSYWAKCNAKKRTLEGIATYKFLFNECTTEKINIR